MVVCVPIDSGDSHFTEYSERSGLLRPGEQRQAEDKFSAAANSSAEGIGSESQTSWRPTKRVVLLGLTVCAGVALTAMVMVATMGGRRSDTTLPERTRIQQSAVSSTALLKLDTLGEGEWVFGDDDGLLSSSSSTQDDEQDEEEVVVIAEEEDDTVEQELSSSLEQDMEEEDEDEKEEEDLEGPDVQEDIAPDG